MSEQRPLIKTVRYSTAEGSRILSQHACSDLGEGTFTTTTQIITRSDGNFVEIVVEVRHPREHEQP